MKKHIEALRAWNDQRKLRRNMNLFIRLNRDPRSGMSRVIDEAAAQVASQKMMRWLDAKRILHCAICPNTESLRNRPLMAHEKLCPGHYERIVTKKPTEKQEAVHV